MYLRKVWEISLLEEAGTLLERIQFRFLRSFRMKFPKTDSNNKLLFNWIKSTKKFVNDYPEILISKADKRNVIIARNKLDYMSKMESMLSDSNTYEMMIKDPTKTYY